VQIMVRTRGLGWTLGWAIEKALEKKEASDDEWRPTAYARRQRQQASVVEDPPIIAKDLNEEQQQPPVEEGVTKVEGFLGEPHDTLVLRDFDNHIALRVWNGEICKS